MGKEPGARPGAAALDRARRGVQDGGGVVDGEPEHVHDDQGRPLRRRQDPQRGVDVQPGIGGPGGIGVVRQQGLERLLVTGGRYGADGPAAQPVK